VLVEELSIVNAEAPSWSAVRPLLEVALRLEQQEDSYQWHGWSKAQITSFLRRLPLHCTLLVGVWETLPNEEHETLVMNCICEVKDATICSIRTFEALPAADLPATEKLEPGFEHAFALMRVVKAQIAPVAWALFTDKATWDEWLFATGKDGGVAQKGELLILLTRQGRCVLLGSQVAHHH
jgi:hypothetical protein